MFAWTLRPELANCLRSLAGELAAPRIRTIDEGRATGLLAETYLHLRQTRGGVANLHRIHSLFPEALDANVKLCDVLLGQGRELSRLDAELIATVVSIENCCDYCVIHHHEALEAESRIQGRPSPIPLPDSESEWDLDPRQRAMLDLATKLAHTPHAVGEDDIDRVRSHGFTDRGILEIVMVASYFCFLNRIALGLGVTPGPEERPRSDP